MHDALSPLDGRYALATAGVRAIFSERALASARVRVEIAWLRALAAQKDVPCPAISPAGSQKLDDLFEQGLTAEGFARVKEIEKDTNHDVKAVEYFLREVLEASDMEALPWIHFGLTSEDVNANAYAMMSREGAAAVAAHLGDVAALLRGQAQEWAELPLLALTHGQPATPVTLGKEIGVFIARLSKLQQQLEQARFGAKLSGATGNFAAHVVALPHADWPRIAREVTQSLGNHYLPLTSQAEPHDDIAAASAQMAHLCAVLTDLCRDIWGYISRGVFAQKTRANEVGSSAMPHKVNPIDFENAEGNAGIAAALFSHFAQKLPVSRFQRDLSDSTVLRNPGRGARPPIIGVAIYKARPWKNFCQPRRHAGRTECSSRGPGRSPGHLSARGGRARCVRTPQNGYSRQAHHAGKFPSSGARKLPRALARGSGTPPEADPRPLHWPVCWGFDQRPWSSRGAIMPRRRVRRQCAFASRKQEASCKK